MRLPNQPFHLTAARLRIGVDPNSPSWAAARDGRALDGAREKAYNLTYAETVYQSGIDQAG
jgi:hypothetical protein